MMTSRAIGRCSILALAAALTAGCHAPPLPEKARNNPYFQQNGQDEDGWLFDRIMGRERKPPEPKPESDVRQATAEEPVYPSQAPVGENLEKALAAEEKERREKRSAESKGFDLSSLAPEKLYQKAKVAAGYGPDEALARKLFDEGQNLYAEKKYAEAADKFSWAAFRWPDSALEEDALFYQGESLFFADRYADANDVFGRLVKKYENSRYLDRAVRRQFAIGRYWEQVYEATGTWAIVPNFTDRKRPMFDTWGNAISVYESIRINDPTGPLADDAIMATANANFVASRYDEAAYHYDLLRKEYPKSEHQYAAHRLGMKAKQSMYQGPMYDGTALDQAGELADQTLRQFRGELGEERGRVVEEKERIVQQQAEREWAMGQFYERKGYYAAARFYYTGLVQNSKYARTEFVPKARERLDAIKDKPDRPTDYFKWLNYIFVNKK